MTRRTALVWALAALGGGTLLWSAWRILSTDLSMTGRALAWALWLLLAAAVVTFFLYARELVRQGVALTRGARWQPVPAVALLWLGGASSLVVFTALMPASSSARQEPVATTQTPAPTGTSTPDPGSAAAVRTSSATTASRTQQRTTAPSSSAPATGSSTPTPSSTSSLPPRTTSTTRPTTPTTTTSTPIIDITILPTHGKPTKPGH